MYIPEFHCDGTSGGYLRRFSCRICIFSTDHDLIQIAKHDPVAFARVSDLEQRLGFTMRPGKTLLEILDFRYLPVFGCVAILLLVLRGWEPHRHNSFHEVKDMRWIIHPEVRAEVRALESCREQFAHFDTSSLDWVRFLISAAGEFPEPMAGVGIRNTEAEEGIPDLNSSPGSLPVQPPPLHQPALSERRRKLAADPALGEPCRILRSDPE